MELCVPCHRAASGGAAEHLRDSGLGFRVRTWRVRGVVLDDGGGGAVELGVHVDVAPHQVALDQQFVLLHVPPADHQVVFAGDEPAFAF